MLKLLVVAAAAAAMAFAVTSVPLHGRTVLDRWRAAPSVTQFAERGWAEAKSAAGLAPDGPRSGRRRPPRVTKASPRPALPTEEHTERDRAALERLLSERAGR